MNTGETHTRTRRRPRRPDAWRRPTLADVAKAAGVSPSTVSDVLNDRPACYASAKTRAQIRKWAQKLGYQPHPAARALRGNSTATVGLIMDCLTYESNIRRYIAFESVARQSGYVTVLTSLTNANLKEGQGLEWLRDRFVDGIAIQPDMQGPHEQLRQLIDSGFPVVTINAAGRLDFPTVDVSVDYLAGGRVQAGHLVDIGRRRIGMLVAAPEYYSVAQRLRGARQVLAEAGIAEQMVVVPEPPQGIAPAEMASVYGQIMQALRGPLARIDGLIAGNDQLALLAMRGLFELGRRVPQDIAVIGYDDTAAAEMAVVPLSTVAQAPEEAGRLAFEMLDRQIARPKPHHEKRPGKSTVVTPRLVIRASSIPSIAGRRV